MSKFGIDLSKFKKVKVDAHSTTLAHPHGHNIIVAHRALSPKMRSQVAALPFADGGEVENSPARVVKKAFATSEKALSGVLSQDDSTRPVEAPAAEAPKEQERLTPEQDDALTKFANSPTEGSSEPEKMGPAYAKGGEVNPKLEQSKKQPPAMMLAEGGGPAAAAPDLDPAAPQMPEEPGVPAAEPPAPAAPNYVVNGNFDWNSYYKANPDSVPIETQTKVLAQENQKQEAVAKQQADAVTTQKNQIDAYNAQAMKQGMPPKPYTPEMEKLSAAQDMATQQQQQAQMPKEAQKSQGPNDPYGTEAYYKNYGAGLEEQKAGLKGEAAAMALQGHAEEKALQEHIQQRQQAVQSYQQHYESLEQERQNFVKDIQSKHIDPQHYMNSMGTGQRVATAVGLILGGMGGGMNGQGNPALSFLEKQIDNDINAQKANLGKSENLLAANMKQFGNLRDATDMTRVMQSDIVSSQLKEAAAKAMDPMAKARALQAAGKLDMDAAPVLSQMAMRRTLLGGMQNGQVQPEQVIRAIVPPNEQNHAYKELQTAQNVVRARDNIVSAFDQVAKINTVGNRVLSPIQAKRQVEAITSPLTAGLSKETAGRFTEQDAKMLETLWPTPGDSAQTINTKRSQINKLVSEKMHFPMLQAYGIDVGSMGNYTLGGQNKRQESAPIIH
jgi:hypothetical protein